MQESVKETITYKRIEEDAMTSDVSLEDYKFALWIFLCVDKENCKSLGRELRVRRYSNPGNVYSAILDRLIGHVDTSHAGIKEFLR